MALRSYGRVTAGRLQELLEKSLPAGLGWKAFWDQARAALRKDPRVVIPARRTDPIQWLDEGRAAHDAWLEELSAEKDPERILTRLEEMEGRGAPERLDAEARRQVGDRLAMVVKGWGDKHPGLLARALLGASRWGLDVAQVNVAALMPRLLDAHALRLAVEEVPTRAVGRLLAELAARDRAKTVQGLTHELGHMSFPAMQATLEFLCEAGESEAARARVRELYGMRQATTSLLLWLARRLDGLETWVGGTRQDLLYQILTILERRHSGTYLRAANLLEELLLQKEWLAAVSSTMAHPQRVALVRFLRDGAGRIGVDTQAVIAKLVLLHPELGESLRTGPAEPEADARQAVTSWRTYRERQRALVKLINEEIPKNSRDIGVARSYGDLRENFEYKAAKEQQAILLRRKDELEAALQAVQGTDFTGCPTEAAGMGTTVDVRFPDGVLQRFHVLGEWDQEPALGIVSCSSRVGQLLAGRRPGDPVELPTGEGTAACRVEAVSGLTEEIRQWLRGEGGSG
jgi:transcription elongation GreA/GreB family factor